LRPSTVSASITVANPRHIRQIVAAPIVTPHHPPPTRLWTLDRRPFKSIVIREQARKVSENGVLRHINEDSLNTD
jgi:hypothetical protein